MKLRNKKTGEIVELRKNEEIIIPVKDNDGEWYEECFTSIAELNEEWEDYEEPKRVYFIDTQNGNVDYFELYNNYICDVDFNDKIGNYFETREEAEKVVECLRAWKRLKDYNVKFNLDFVRNRINFTYSVNSPLLSVLDGEEQIFNNMKIIFGGEE